MQIACFVLYFYISDIFLLYLCVWVEKQYLEAFYNILRPRHLSCMFWVPNWQKYKYIYKVSLTAMFVFWKRTRHACFIYMFNFISHFFLFKSRLSYFCIHGLFYSLLLQWPSALKRWLFLRHYSTSCHPTAFLCSSSSRPGLFRMLRRGSSQILPTHLRDTQQEK